MTTVKQNERRPESMTPAEVAYLDYCIDSFECDFRREMARMNLIGHLNAESKADPLHFINQL